MLDVKDESSDNPQNDTEAAEHPLPLDSGQTGKHVYV